MSVATLACSIARDMHRSFRLASLAILCVPSAQEARRPEVDVGPLAASLAAYAEARASASGLDAAEAALVQRMDELSKSLGANPLQNPELLGRAIRSSRACKEERGGRVASATFAQGSFAGAGLSYAYRLPREYDPSRAYPLILSIPATDEEPDDHIRQHWAQRDIQDQVILVCPAMPAERETWDRVMVRGRPGGLCHALTALRLACERFAVDFDRVFVAGRAKGVPAALAAGNTCPQRFAGVIARAGDAGELGPENFVDLPTFFAGGGAQARAFAEAAKAAGHDNSRFQVDASEDDIWNWMLDNPRRTHPEQVVLVPGDPFPTRAYWLQVSPSAPQCRARGVIERATNTVRIDTEGMALATLFLNDLLLDLSQPVRVVLNGVERSVLVPRRLSSFLDLLHDGTSDPAAVYVARAEFELTGAENASDDVAASDPELERRLAEAGSDVAELWKLHTSLAPAQATRVLRAIVRLDPGNEKAREALGHVRSGERWFTSQAALERFLQSQDPEAARAKGHVEYRSLWMHPAERAIAVKGWVKDQETGQWLTPGDEKRLTEGWARQDLEWIPPEEAGHADAGLWRVDGEWLPLHEADRRHAALDSMWRIPGAEVLLLSTADREVALRAQQVMGRALADLRRVFGAEPVLPLRVALLRDEEQYDRFAFGDPDGRRPPSHAGRLHAVHSAFFAESWFPKLEGRREFMGLGVCIWDSQVPNGDLYGLHAARLAVGLSYVDALDPSPNAVKKALADGPGSGFYAAYEAEKALPAWLRFGGAVYAERYFEDTEVEDRWWARKWSLENLQKRGGMRALSEVLDFRLDPDDRDDALKRLLEAGLVVAFVVDGECAPLDEAHAAFKESLASGKVDPRRVSALTEALVGHERELRAFAGL